MPRPRSVSRFLHRAASAVLCVTALVTWPACWIGVGLHHNSICGDGLSSIFCDEPMTTAIAHQVLTSLSPWTSVLLFVAADRFWSRP
jgi:hypothetical protein